jgi:SAM-dependent methyltransferase
MAGSVPPDYFRTLYDADPDPWKFATSDYERRKYDATLDALPPRQFRRALEAGCSIGVFTERLAARAEAIVALDVDEGALAQARARCAGIGSIEFEQAFIPGTWEKARDLGRKFDLCVLSEILYYLSPNDLRATVAHVRRSLDSDGVVVLVNWLGETGTARSGDRAAAHFIAASRNFLGRSHGTRTPEYRIDLLRAR